MAKSQVENVQSSTKKEKKNSAKAFFVRGKNIICLYVIIKVILLCSYKQYVGSSGENIFITLAIVAVVALCCCIVLLMLIFAMTKTADVLMNQRETTLAGSRSAIFVNEK